MPIYLSYIHFGEYEDYVIRVIYAGTSIKKAQKAIAKHNFDKWDSYPGACIETWQNGVMVKSDDIEISGSN